VTRALITGVTGQIGHYLAELLTARGLEVFGLVRQTTNRASAQTLPYQPVTGDLLDEYSLQSILEQVKPAFLYNFGAQSFIPGSWAQPILTAQYTGLGVVRLLEAVRRVVPECRVLQAGSSELFAGAAVTPQDESAPIRPLNPYGIAKAFAYHTMLAYRRQYGLFASNAIFFTNESPRRAPEFLFRKVTRAVAEIVAGKRHELVLGNLDTVRDWGFAPEFAGFAVDILGHREADDFVVATGEGHRVGELVEQAFRLVGRDWRNHVRVESTLVRPSEPAPLVGNPAKLERLLGRRAQVRFESLLRIMLAHDLRLEGAPVPFSAEMPAIT
jgi:GDPmannose 4,6-dehydratase